IERCQGAGCSSYSQIGTSATTTFNNSGLTASTTYSYRVRATDAANNMSGFSNTATATTSGGGAAPIAFVQTNNAVPQSPQTTVTVPFTAAQSAGNLNVVAVGWFDTTSSVLSVTDTRGHTYVRAVGPTTHGVAGTHSIYYAAGIAASAAGTNSVTVTFNAAVQYPDVRIAEYRGIDPTNPVDVVAAASGSSATSNSGAVTTTNANDLLVGANYVSTSTTGPGSGYTQRVITSPNGSILEDRIVTTTGSNSATAPLQSGSWIMQLVAFRAASAGGGDTQAPTAPTGLGASAVSSAQINLSWTGSTDDVGVTNYLIERCSGAGCSNFAQIGTSATTSFNNTGLAASTSYSYRVRATDAANNLSGYSNTASATTQTIVDTQAPTAPTNLTATPISGTQINLSWTASSDNVGVTNYLIERCQSAGCTDFAQIATSATTSFSNTGLTVGTTYRYRVRATDAANNLSAYSSIATGVTPVPDTQAPTAPSGLSATAVSSSQINLSWTASSDNVAVTNYLVERCSGAGCSNFAQVGTSATTAFNNTGLTGSTSYSYRVRATDAANNLSGYSNVASATTQQGQQLPPLSFVQGASAIPQAPVSSVNAAFPGNQIGGRLNVVAIGWFNTTSQITSVTDTAGNTYVLAAGPTTQAQAGRHAIYYAAGINASGANNRVTVTFNNAVPFPDLRIAEYAGVDPSDPLDSGVEASGTGATSSSGALTTTSPNALLVAANYVTTATNAPGSGFTTRMITNPNGSILEDRIVSAAGSYTATASLSPAGSWIMQMVAFRGGPPPPPDTTPPSISLSGPAPGTTLSGTATLQAMASDLGSGVAGVQFQVDGINVGPAINNQPYQLSLNTALFANGTHVITVYGWDQVRNIATATSVTVTFNNGSPGAPAVTGLWQGPFPWPLVSIHLNLLSDGRLLAWDQLSTGTPDPRVWDPVTSAFTVVPVNDGSNLFCSGHSTLPDGRLFVAGGEVSGIGSATANSHVGLATGHIFNPATNLWTSTSNMQYGRWYPTQTTLPDGRVLTLQGETNCFGCDATVPEIYNATNNTWTQLNSAQLNAPWYPYTFVLPNGRIAVAGGAENADVTRVLDLTNNTWTTVDNRVIDGGSAAMYLPGKVIKSGTSNSTEGGVFSSTANAWVIDFTAGSPAWRAVPSMAFPRTYHVMTQLPDGSVLVTGGGRTTGFADIPNAVKQAELWSPTSETWTTLASMSAPRLYHQTAVLLPDARVLVSGSGRGFGRSDPTDQLSGEIFAPPYLFKGPRPTITSAPSQLSYGQVFNVNTPNAANIAKVTLVRTSSVTHTFNMDTRYLPLTFTAGSGSLSVTAPANANLAPPGYYMLFIVDNAGVPSVSAMVRF
ncbi:MAG TPA: fibronectin type III domain-containing protein, partial [Steroidobacteraceae bacterium]|nr:fibronectin type III domain-containing protein [Steroidobacteraceae bacterium]